MHLFFIIILCCASNVGFLYSADQLLFLYNDSSFLMWCGALTCQEIERKQIGNTLSVISPRKFLGIDDVQYPGDNRFMRKSYSEDIKPFIEEESFFDETTGVSEMRFRDIQGNYRCRSIVGVDQKNNSQLGSPMHVDIRLKHGSDLGSQFPTFLYDNSIIVNKQRVLSAGTCADKKAEFWISCSADISATFLESLEEKTDLVIRLLWTTALKKPICISQIKLPAGSFEVARNSCAVKFIDNDTAFQLYYDPSIHKFEAVDLDTNKVEPHPLLTTKATTKYVKLTKHIQKIDPIIITYTLNRIRTVVNDIPQEILLQWYDVFENFKNGVVAQDMLQNTKKSMSNVLINIEASK